MNIKINQKLPSFNGRTFDGQEFNLSNLAEEQNLVVYFYPKDDTANCTREGVGFSELNHEFRKLNTRVVGLSRDGLYSHQNFCKKYNLQIPLLSDAAGGYGRRLGLLKETGTFKRTTVLVGRDGKVKHIWENVKVEGHAREVLSKVKELEHQVQKKLALGRDIGPKRREYQKPGQRAWAGMRSKR